MSGGHWNYEGFKLKDVLEQIGNDPSVKERFPRLSAIFPKLANVLYEIEHDLDWDLSNDSAIENDKTFEGKAIADILEAVKGPERRKMMDDDYKALLASQKEAEEVQRKLTELKGPWIDFSVAICRDKRPDIRVTRTVRFEESRFAVICLGTGTSSHEEWWEWFPIEELLARRSEKR